MTGPIEFMKEMPWRLPWNWCGLWAWLKLPNGNIAKVTLSQPQRVGTSLMFASFEVTITNPTTGQIANDEFLFAHFLKVRIDGEINDVYVPQIAFNEFVGWMWNGDNRPISMHPIINAIEEYALQFGGE